MTWRVSQSLVIGTAIVTDHWPDLQALPQPVFHRDELALLAHAKATPERYADVALVKRVFRGAWVTHAGRKRRPPRPIRIGRRMPTTPVPVEYEED